MSDLLCRSGQVMGGEGRGSDVLEHCIALSSIAALVYHIAVVYRHVSEAVVREKKTGGEGGTIDSIDFGRKRSTKGKDDEEESDQNALPAD